MLVKEYRTELLRNFAWLLFPVGHLLFSVIRFCPWQNLVWKIDFIHFLYRSVPQELAQQAIGKPELASFCLRAACSMNCPVSCAKIPRFSAALQPIGFRRFGSYALQNNSQHGEPGRLKNYQNLFFISQPNFGILPSRGKLIFHPLSASSQLFLF